MDFSILLFPYPATSSKALVTYAVAKIAIAIVVFIVGYRLLVRK